MVPDPGDILIRALPAPARSLEPSEGEVASVLARVRPASGRSLGAGRPTSAGTAADRGRDAGFRYDARKGPSLRPRRHLPALRRCRHGERRAAPRRGAGGSFGDHCCVVLTAPFVLAQTAGRHGGSPACVNQSLGIPSIRILRCQRGWMHEG